VAATPNNSHYAQMTESTILESLTESSVCRISITFYRV